MTEGSFHSEEGIKLEDFSLKAGAHALLVPRRAAPQQPSAKPAATVCIRSRRSQGFVSSRVPPLRMRRRCGAALTGPLVCGAAAGEAKLVVQGALLGERQNASVVVTEFPMAMLQPMFRAVPALQHAAPAVGTAAPSAPAGPAAAFLNNLTLPFLKSVLLPDRAPAPCCPPCVLPVRYCCNPRPAPGPGAGLGAQARGVEGQRGRWEGGGVQHEQLHQQPSERAAVRAGHPG